MVEQSEGPNLDEPYVLKTNGKRIYADESGILPAEVGVLVIGPNGGGYAAPL